jgi:hypothetical protein
VENNTGDWITLPKNVLRIGRVSMLVPIAKRGDRQVKCVGELHLRHAKTLPQDLGEQVVVRIPAADRRRNG